ncbi:glycoside hydrolase family 2 TIM barrel [Cellulophaga algicola DSM 14237]|uniref:Glycoside hydrolase family 2 TIM barrel n=1 Tax=Cellulophaga algicola (strain DSM 14237 / IC166 / ACAM 630) TaxID=688270 RepID=E6XF93_CELAD|nr:MULTISPECIES: glycoside hydrolase family 2 TIM barrel-domain containing protein [Cellulophaga]ADV50329.1 glycoside hydrolase family 2 TIM barrel [Cellulophaga algicola DSM 14237]
MAFKLNKTLYRIIIIVTFVGVNALILSGIGSAWVFLNTGADRTSMLHLEVPMDEVYRPSIEWTDLENPGRPIEEQTLGEITNDYLNAWHVRNIAFKKNDYYGVEDFYTDSARVRLYDNIDLNLKNNNWYKRTTLSHKTAVDFYSTDGTMVVFKDYNVEEYQEIYTGEELLYAEKDTTSYHVMMLLEDGFWRIRHLKEIENSPDTTKIADRNINSKIEKIKQLKGINYYPKDSPWDTFGKRFNDTVIDKDFKILQKMGVNAIRIFVQYEDFGKSMVAYKKINSLKKILDLAEQNNLDVLITLFDFYGDYDVSNWTLTHRHAEAIVNAVKEHPALLGWDLKNEPDLDFESRGRLRVLGWLEQMIANIKKWDRNHPVTIGWSSPEAAVELADQVDFVSYHYYKEASKFKVAHHKLAKAVPTKPKLLQEYGVSSYKGLWNLYRGANEQGQLEYYEEMQAILSKEKIPFMFWTLYDFEKVPSSVAGSLPWKSKKQHFFGCLDSLGNPKPSFKVLSNLK